MEPNSLPEPSDFTRRRFLTTAALAAGASLALTAIDVGPARAATWLKGLDSNQDPDPGEIARAGYRFLSFYLAGPGSMTAAKVAACAANGVSVVANWEYSNPVSGTAEGVADAQKALAAANACGIPADRPIYFSLDWDVAYDSSKPGFPGVDAYLDGVAQVLPRSRIGIYSSTTCIDHMVGNGKATWFWQSMSGGFSGGRNATLNPRTHIWQRGYYTTPGGRQCDWDYAITSDYGQWGYGKPSHVFSGASTIMTASETIATYRAGSDANVWGTDQSAPYGSYGPWQRLTTGGAFTGKPQAIQNGSGLLSFYVRQAGQIWGASQQVAGGPFTGLAPLNSGGGAITSDPTVIYTASGIVAVYVTAGDGNVWGANQTQVGGAFTSWAPLTSGGGYNGKPAVIQAGNGALSLYARKAGQIWGASQSGPGSAFTGWYPLNSGGGAITSDPTVIHTASGIVAVYVTAGDGNVWGANQTQVGGAFTSWAQLTTGGNFAGDPAVIQSSNSMLSLYVNNNHQIQGTSQQSVNGAFGSWQTLGTGSIDTLDSPVVLQNSSGVVAIFVEASDGRIWATSQSQVQGPFGPWGIVGS